MKKVYLTDKQAGSALFSSLMGAEVTIAQLKKKLKDRERRLRFIAYLLNTAPSTTRSVGQMRRLVDLRDRLKELKR